MSLSIDIGFKYLAFAYLKDFTIQYGMHIIADATPELIAHSIREFLGAWEDGEIDLVLVEKQVPQNTKCTKIMHIIVGVVTGLGIRVHLVDARNKFRALGVTYSTLNHAHKFLSIELALAWLKDSGIEDLSPTKLSEYGKQDDISDAINQLRGWIIDH
jgi:hypothetical protein